MSDEKPCVFCDRKNFQERLIGESDHLYFIATLGQITDGGYALFVPKRHVLCIGAMEIPEIETLTTEAIKLDGVIKEEYHDHPTIFEHGIVGQSIKHAHLHFVPVPCMLSARVKMDFPDSEIEIFRSFSELKLSYAKKRLPYLFWNDFDGQSRVCWNPPAPPQYFRKVIAEIVSRPERTDWRTMDPKLDKQLWSETVKRLGKYY